MTLANASLSTRLRQARNNSQIGSLKALIGVRPSSFLSFVLIFLFLVTFCLVNSQSIYAGTHADGDSPTGGRSFYVTTESGTVTSCSNAGCHTNTPSGGFPDLAAIANSPTTLINLANANASMTAANRTRANSRRADLSAYFASTLSPQVNTPPNRTLNPGDSYSQAITAPAGSDFLVSTTSYEITAGALPTGISITGNPGVAAAFSGSISSTNTVDRGVFSVTFRARNTDAGTNAVLLGPTQTFSITVRAAQIINFGAVPTVRFNSTGVVTATGGGSGNPVTFTSLTPTQCSVTTGGTVTGLVVGTNNCIIAADQGANLVTNFVAANQATQTISIQPANQTIGFGVTPTVVVNGTGTVSATASSGLSVSFSSATPGTCNVTGTTVTGITAGLCTVNADQAGNLNFNPAPQVTQNINIGLGSQVITFGPPPSLSVGLTGSLNASGGLSGNPVVLSSLTNAVCTISGNTVTAISAGVCSIAANQAGNVNFNAATQTILDFGIGAGAQTITFGAPPSVVVNGTGTVSATSTSGLAVSFSSATPGTCSVTGTTVTGITAGLCTVNANQTGNVNFSAAPQVTQNINIGVGSQTISFGAPPSVVVNGTGTVSATSTSGLAVSFSSATPGTCSVTGTTVTGITAGLCTVNASQVGNVNFSAAPQVTQNINIGLGSQTISFGAPPSVVVNGTGTVSATSSSGLGVSFSSTTPSTCSVTGTTVTGITAGVCTVAANQAGNVNFNPAPQLTQNINIGVGSQSIVFGAAPTLIQGATGSVSATANSGLPVTFSIPSTTSICSISGNTVTALAVGVCTVAADQAGNTNFAAAAQQTQNINIGAAPVTASAVSIDVPLNTATTVNLAPFIAGSAVTGVKLLSQPTGGSATTNGTNITYVPKNNFFGTDSLSYAAFGTTGESAPAVITINIIGRPDPTQEQNVRNLVSNQLATAQRFNRAQSLNFQQRLETLHGRIGNRGSQSNTDVATNEPKGSTLGDVEARSIGLRIQDNQQREKAGLIANSPQGITQATQQVTAQQANTQQANTPSATGNLPNNTFSSSNAMMADARPLTDGEALAGVLNGSVGNTLIETLRSKSINLAALSGAINNGLAKNDPDAVEIWMAGNVRVGSVEQEGFDFSNYKTDGITVGLDKPFGDHLILGLGLSYARDTSELASDGSKAMAKGLSLSVYGSYQAAENTYIDAMVGYGMIDYESKRFVSSVGAFADANRDGDQFFASIAGAYEYKNQGYMLSPYARLDLSYNRLDSTTESGAGLNALRYGDSNARFAQVSAGFRAEANHQANFGIITPRMRLEYQASTQSNDDTNIQYADQLGGNFRLAGTTNRQGSIVFGLGSDILMKNGIRLGLDYQSLRSPGTESSQALSFRLAKDLGVTDNKLPILDTESLALPKLGIRLDMGYTYDDNVNRARENDEKLQDRVYSFNLNKGKNFSINANSRIVLNGFFGAEKSYYFRGLDRVSLGTQAEYQYRTSGAFTAPTYGVFTRVSTEQFNSELRDNVRISSGINFRKPITDKLSTFAALAYNKRNASSEVFDLDEISLRANFDYQTFSDSTLYFTGELRHGDIVSTARPSLENLDGSDANVLDDVFKQQGYASYRFKGNTALATLGYNLPIGPTDGLDFSWRWVQSTPSDVPNYVNDKRSYYDNQFSIVYLVRF